MSDKVQRIYTTKTIESGKRLEVFKYSYPITEGRESNNKDGRKGKQELSQEEKKFNKEQKRKQTLYIARNNIIRLISANEDELRTFITLTYKENMQDIKQSRKDLDIFFKRLRRKYKDLKYIWVMEYQFRGAIHFHLLTNIPIKIITAKPKEKKSMEQKQYENEFRDKFWQHGFIDLRNIGEENDIRNVGKYIACYLVQDILDLDLQGNRVYGYSKNLNKPMVNTLETRDSIEALISLDNYDLKFINSYDLYYRNKRNEEVKGQVTYLDYIKNND